MITFWRTIGEKEEEELEGSSSDVIVGGDLLLFGDGGEAIGSTRKTRVYLQEAPRDLTHEDHEHHVSMLIGNETKQWRDRKSVV